MGRNKKSTIPTRKLRKDPGVPKLPDLKLKREMKKASNPISKNHFSTTDSMDTVQENFLAALAGSTADVTGLSYISERSIDQAKRQYIRTLYKVIEQSDVIIIVLDARDPEGCRAKVVEEEVRRQENEGKKLIFVLNKVDLVSQENAMAWLRYLRHTAPTIPFRSSTQQQSTNLKSRSVPGLLNLIKSYRNSPVGKITVGVVGYPNVGKSSLINSLKRSKACAVAAEAGWTRDLQYVQVDRGIRIIDSPGVIFDDVDPESAARIQSGILLRNVLKVEDIGDPLTIVEEIVNRTSKETLQRVYKLPDWSSTSEFVAMVALTTGRLLKGGTPDSLSAARSILQDWNCNKIPYFSVPPVAHSSILPSTIPGAEDVGQLTIIQGGFGTAFDLGKLYGEAMQDDDVNNNMLGQNQNMAPDVDFFSIPCVERSLSPEFCVANQEPQPTYSSGKRRVHTSSESTSRSAAITVHKRAKPTYEVVLNPQIQSTLSTSNPLGRRNIKMNLKKGRKMARKAIETSQEGMVVEEHSDS